MRQHCSNPAETSAAVLPPPRDNLKQSEHLRSLLSRPHPAAFIPSYPPSPPHPLPLTTSPHRPPLPLPCSLPGLASALEQAEDSGESFLHTTLPEIVRRALAARRLLPHGVPLLGARAPKTPEDEDQDQDQDAAAVGDGLGASHVVALSCEQAAAILANMFLGNPPQQPRGARLPFPNSFEPLFENPYPQEVRC